MVIIESSLALLVTKITILVDENCFKIIITQTTFKDLNVRLCLIIMSYCGDLFLVYSNMFDFGLFQVVTILSCYLLGDGLGTLLAVSFGESLGSLKVNLSLFASKSC